jgi:hypothetical protein
MAFIDWLKKQHADSLRASQRMAADPFLRGVQPGANTAPAPQGAIPFQRTKPGFFARDYKKEDLVKKVMIEKNDGTKEIKSEWEEPRFPVHQGNVRATALPNIQSPPLSAILPRPPIPRADTYYPEDLPEYEIYRPGQTGEEYGAYPRRLRPQASIANIGVPQAHVPRMRGDIGATESIGTPDISNQRAMYHALRRPHPQVASTLSAPQQTQQNIWGSRFVPNPASMIRKDRSSPEDLPVGMDEEQWKFILDRIYGGR